MKKILFLTLSIINYAILHCQNVGIGTTNVTSAKLTVEGGVGPVVGLFKNGSGVSIAVSGNNENIGLNYADGKAIATGIGARIFLSNSASTGGIGLQFYSSANAGTSFPTAINVLRHIDNRWAGSGHWLDMLYDEPGRLRVANQLYNMANGTMNLLPLGAIYFNVTNMHNNNNATRVIANVGNGGTLYQTQVSFLCHAGSLQTLAVMRAIISLDWVTKDYDDIYIVGSPNFDNDDTEIYGSSARFIRKPIGEKDQIQIECTASRLWSTSAVFGTLLIYGNRTLN